MTKHADHVINLANEDVDIVGMFNKHGSFCCGVMLAYFVFVQNCI